MRYCTRCVQPDTRPGVVFDAQGVCLACRMAEGAPVVDWEARRRRLDEIATFCRESNVSGYDCVIGVSGGKDSTRQAMYARDELGLKPLLVCCTYPPEQLAERGAKNLANLVSLGFDTVTVGPGPQTWKKMLRNGFVRFGNWAKSSEMALYASAPKVALAYHIPVAFLGENPGISVGTLDAGSTSEDAGRMKNCHTLSGGPEALLDESINKNDLYWYRYLQDEEMELSKLRIYYLGYFIRDFDKRTNAKFSMEHGLETRTEPPEEIGDITGYEALDEDFVTVNQMLKYVKFGFGKVTDQVCEDIRLKRMTREQGVEMVKKYDGKCGEQIIRRFCCYLEITMDEFHRVVESHRNLDIWERTEGHWRLKTPLE